jgi:hypothetical protein
MPIRIDGSVQKPVAHAAEHSVQQLTFIQSRGAFTDRCSRADWGLRNIAQGDLVKVARRQVRAYGRR